MIEYYIRQFPMPDKVRGFVTPNDDGTFSIYINSNLSDALQKKALEHELKHIAKDHFYDEIKSLEVVEIEAS